MKKKMIVALLCSLVVSSLTGCGKTRVDKTAETYEEYGFTKEEARELAELENEFYEENKEWEEQYAKQVAEEEALAQEAEDSFRLCEVSDEIKNSTVYDEIVQVGDIVLPNDGSLTVRDLVDRLSINGPVKILENDKEITADSLVNPTGSMLGRYAVADEYNNELCSILYINATSNIANAFDSIVVNITAPYVQSPNILNFFYPGNICPAVFTVFPEVKELPAYEKRVSEYKEMTYQSVEDDLKALGAKNIEVNDMKYTFYVYSKKPVYQQEGEEPSYRRISYSFHVNMDTAKVTSFDVGTSCASADSKSFLLNDFSVMTPELKSQLEEKITAELAYSYRDLADESVEVVGYYLKEYFDKYDCVAVCLTDRGTYEPVTFSIYENYRGEPCMYDYVGASSGDTCSTLEELLANENVDASQFISIK